MKFTVIALLGSVSAVAHHHHHHPHYHNLVATLPDVRADTVSDTDIAAHELARSEAAKVKKNPQTSLLATIKEDLEAINTDMSFGVSHSQKDRNTEAKDLCSKVSTAILGYSNALISKVEGGPNETLTE